MENTIVESIHEGDLADEALDFVSAGGKFLCYVGCHVVPPSCMKSEI